MSYKKSQIMCSFSPEKSEGLQVFISTVNDDCNVTPEYHSYE